MRFQRYYKTLLFLQFLSFFLITQKTNILILDVGGLPSSIAKFLTKFCNYQIWQILYRLSKIAPTLHSTLKEDISYKLLKFVKIEGNLSNLWCLLAKLQRGGHTTMHHIHMVNFKLHTYIIFTTTKQHLTIH